MGSIVSGGLAAIATGARRGGPGPPRASPSSTACSVLFPPSTSSGARPSSASAQPWTQDGWEDPLEDQEDTGPDADSWGAYGLFDDELDDCFRDA